MATGGCQLPGSNVLPKALRPYLSAFLAGSEHWNSANIGIALSASAIATVVAQTPAGALVDRLNQKRMLIILGAVCVAIGCIGIALFPTFEVVMACQILIGVAAAIFPPAIAAITLGLVGRSKLDKKTARIQTFNHSGNVIAAVLSALVSQFITHKGVFFVIGGMAVGSAISARMICYREIDQEVARGGGDDEGEGDEKNESREEDKKEKNQAKPAGILKLLSDRRILMFFGAVVLFNFANAAMLPLVGQLLARGRPSDSILFLSACIIVAQLVMAPTSALVGRLTEAGRKPIFLVCFGVLPIRGVLYTLWHDPYYLVFVQILDGVVSGIFSVLSILVIADLTKGTGRFNLTQGLLATAMGIGGFFSNLIAGFVVHKAGYNVGFLMLAAIAAAAFAVLWFFVPETKAKKKQGSDKAAAHA